MKWPIQNRSVILRTLTSLCTALYNHGRNLPFHLHRPLKFSTWDCGNNCHCLSVLVLPSTPDHQPCGQGQVHTSDCTAINKTAAVSKKDADKGLHPISSISEKYNYKQHRSDIQVCSCPSWGNGVIPRMEFIGPLVIHVPTVA